MNGNYNKDGYSIFNAYSNLEWTKLYDYTTNWLYSLIAATPRYAHPLDLYHIWGPTVNINHDEVFNKYHRYVYPEDNITKVLLNSNIRDFLSSIGLEEFNIWDDGWGWMGFRFIRPNNKDGYYFSKKKWGNAKNVTSFWIPIIGFTNSTSLSIVKNSKGVEYKTKSDVNRPTELFYDGNIEDLNIYKPTLNVGDVIAYDSDLMHSENIESGNRTRLNLEFRIYK